MAIDRPSLIAGWIVTQRVARKAKRY